MKTPGDTKAHTRDITLDTYRYLRGGMAVMIVMLGTAVIGERLTAACWQTSISAYYFTAAHSIFIAALCALSMQFIVYKGSSDTEDVLLTLAGILGFVVAMVPTTRPVLLCGRYGLPAEYDVKHAITNNVWAVVIALVIARAVSWWLYPKHEHHPAQERVGHGVDVPAAGNHGRKLCLIYFLPKPLRFDCTRHCRRDHVPGDHHHRGHHGIPRQPSR